MTTKKTTKKVAKKTVAKTKKQPKQVVTTEAPGHSGVKNIVPPTDISSLVFIYNGATNFEKKGIYGIAHLMEHLFCKKFEHLQPKLLSEGIDWTAYTTDNRIVFSFEGLEENLSKLRPDILKAFYAPFRLTPATLKKEKAIVGEEYDGVFSDLGSAHYHLFLRRYYSHFGAIGLKEDIMCITVKDCNEFYDKQYSCPDIIINSSRHFVLPETYQTKDRYEVKREFVLNKPKDDTEIEIINRALAAETKNIFVFQAIDEKDAAMAACVSDVLALDLPSPLYKEVREKRGLVYGIGAGVLRVGTLNGIMISAQTNTKNTTKVIATVDMILKNPEKYITKSRVDDVKKGHGIRTKKEKAQLGDVSNFISPYKREVNKTMETLTREKVIKFIKEKLRPVKKSTCWEVF